MNDFILIEYSNSVDLGGIIYHNGFQPKIYLDADVSKPRYEIEEDGIEDADGQFDPTWQKWAKKYSITFYAEEYLIDALSLMTLHDQVYITLKNGESSLVLDVEMEDPSWDASIECWAEVTISFTTEYIIKKNCDENEDECVAPKITVGYAYDADDGSTGQDKWEGTTATNGETAFFYTATAGSSNGYYVGTSAIIAGVYRFDSDNGWELIEIDDGDFVDVTAITDCVYLVKDDVRYWKVPYITSVTDNADGTATVKANAVQVEDMFYQLQYDSGGGFADIGDPQLASAFEAGVTVTTGAGTFDFRINWYTHSCDYGTGNEVEETITVAP